VAIDLDSGTGLFDRLGRIGYVYQVVTDFFAGVSANQLEKEVNDILLEYDGASNVVRSAVEGVLESKSRFQLDPERFLLDLAGAAELTLIEMAHADNPLQQKTLERAIAELIKQMRAASETVDANEPAVSTSAAAGNDGTATIVCSLTGPKGERLEYVYPEDITLTCSVAAARTGTIEVFGESSAAPTGQSVFWPDGSAAATTLAVIDPSADGFLVNGDFENWTTGVLNSWTAITGTFAEETSIRQFGLKAARVTGNGSTLHQIRQEVTSLVESQTVYVATISLQLSSVPAAGVLVLDLFDGISVINDDAGNAQTFSISLTSGISTSQFTTLATTFRLPTPLPDNVYFRVRFSTALSNTVILYVDSCSFGAEAVQIYEGGPYIAVVSTFDKLAAGDNWNIAVTNDLRGGIQTLFWRLFDRPDLMLPSTTGGTETVADSLIG
jgi:hypothetical protein